MKKKWRPSASIEVLIQRAKIIENIRLFFSKKNILEVETPILSQFAITDINLYSFETQYQPPYKQSKNIKLWLTTSPEYHMKRLLASNSGSIYQICHSFRNKELGRYHNPEFTMLEWYQTDCTMQEFIIKIDNFFQKILKFEKSNKISYQKIFIKYLNIDPLSTNLYEIQKKYKSLNLENLIKNEKNVNKLIEVLFSLKIQPFLGKKNPLFVYNFPVEQASFSAINTNDYRISERFEIFFKGIELGNGFYELIDYIEQKKRIIKENRNRFNLNLPKRKIDKYFLSAIRHGLPPCSGVAIGLDRLIMIALNKNSIDKVISFTFDRA